MIGGAHFWERGLVAHSPTGLAKSIMDAAWAAEAGRQFERRSRWEVANAIT